MIPQFEGASRKTTRNNWHRLVSGCPPGSAFQQRAHNCVYAALCSPPPPLSKHARPISAFLLDYDVDTYFYRQLVCLNISATGVKSGKGTSDLAAACNDEVGCQYADAYGECNPDPALMGTCADPLHPRYNGGTACKPNTPTDAPTAAPTASPTSTPTGAGSGDNFLTPPTGTESGAATVSVRIVYAVASVVLPLASSLLC